jgi:hypothetical protein
MEKDTGEDAGPSISEMLKEMSEEGHPAGHRLESEGSEAPKPGEKGKEGSEEEGKKKVGPSEEEGEDKGGEESEFKPKYKTHEEAEKAYGEAEKSMHKSNERASKAEKRNAELEEKLKGYEKAPEKEPEKDPLEAIADKYTEMASKLDPNDPELSNKTMKLLTKQSAEVTAYFNKKSKEDSAQAADIGAQRLKSVREALKEVGLSDWEQEFFDVTHALPKSIKDWDDAVKWGVEKVQKIVEKSGAISKKAKEEQEEKEKESYSLGSQGGNKQSSKKDEGKEDEGPKSISEDMAVLRKQRVLK